LLPGIRRKFFALLFPMQDFRRSDRHPKEHVIVCSIEHPTGVQHMHKHAIQCYCQELYRFSKLSALLKSNLHCFSIASKVQMKQ